MSSEAWQEPMATAARRHHLRAAIREKVVASHVLDQMRQERAERVKASATMAGSASEEAG